MPSFHSASITFGISIPYPYLLSAQFWDLHCFESQFVTNSVKLQQVDNRIEILICHRLTQIDQTSVNNCCKLRQAVLVPDHPRVLMLLSKAKVLKKSTAFVFFWEVDRFCPLSIDFKESKNCHWASGTVTWNQKTESACNVSGQITCSQLSYSDFGTFPLNHFFVGPGWLIHASRNFGIAPPAGFLKPFENGRAYELVIKILPPFCTSP